MHTLQPDDEGRVNITRLAPADKRAAWAAIQRNRPDIAETIQQENFQALREAFDAEVCVDADAVSDFKNEGEQGVTR
jgi:hypothetical protein